MKFFWQSPSWTSAPTLSRRSFVTGLAATLAAPMIVKSGVLMPVRALILPEKQAFVVRTVASWHEVSKDGINWLKIGRTVGPEGARMAIMAIPARFAGWQYRAVIDRSWTPLKAVA